MKNLILAVASGTLLASSVALQADDVVYNNSTTKLNLTYGSTFEFGDEISLSGTNRLLSTLIFEYFGRDFSGNEQVKLRIYANDGTSTGSVPDAQRPGTELYSSDWDSIGETFGDGLTLAYDLSSANLILPESFTWTVEFQGIEAGEFAGLELYSPPTVGISYDDYWERDASNNWVQRFSNVGTSMNFGARVLAISPVPEIITQPSDISVEEGNNVTFTVVARGASLRYQWMRNGANISDATNASYSINNVALGHAGAYNVLVTNDYGFALSTDATLTVSNRLIRIGGRYNGLFYENGGVEHRSSGFFTINLRTNGNYSAKILLDGDTIGFSGKATFNGLINKVISRARFGKENITFDADLTTITNTQMTGTFTSPLWTSELSADHVEFSLLNQPTNYLGRYTMLIPGFTNSVDGPIGYGYGLVLVKPSGAIYLGTGRAADGHVIRQNVPVSKEGRWPFYARLYRSPRTYTNLVNNTLVLNKSYYTGSMLGWLTFTNNKPVGTVSWINPSGIPAHPSLAYGSYPAGFTNETEIISSAYNATNAGWGTLSTTNGTVTLTSGNLVSPFVQPFGVKTSTSVARRFVFQTNTITMSLNFTMGHVYGRFKNPQTGLYNKIYGALIQDQNLAAGMFYGTNYAGGLLVNP